jgi:hypothetical protein
MPQRVEWVFGILERLENAKLGRTTDSQAA